VDLVDGRTTTPTRSGEVARGKAALGDLRDPSRNPVALARENNRKLAVWLRSIGLCAYAGQEALFILRVDGLWEEQRGAAETDGGWTQARYIGEHRAVRPVLDAPPDAPPIPEAPVVACAGVPPLHSFVVHRTDIRGNWEKFDSTPHVEGQAYCESIGYYRNPCPAGMEGYADRHAREACALRGPAPVWIWTGSGRDGGLWPGNALGFSFEHRKGSVGSLSVCDAARERCQVVIG
jgi:hypothetical protein